MYHGGSAAIIPNQRPVALAGPDQVVNDTNNSGTATVTIDGSASFDSDGFIVSYQWFEVTTVGTSPLGSNATLAASFGLGSHTLRLIVTDNDGGSASDTVIATVDPAFALLASGEVPTVVTSSH